MAEILSIDLAAPQREAIARAADLIRTGGVIAIPTDTVYGLAADPFNRAAVERVFDAKGRPVNSPILLLVDSLAMAESLAVNLPASFALLATRFWPGPLTIVVDAARNIPPLVTAHTGRIGLRWPDAAIPRALIAALRGPITATSANVSGQPECRSAPEVQAALGAKLPLILDGGPSTSVKTSTVVGLTKTSWDLIREGAIACAEIEAAMGTAPVGRG